jgi:hypothetical protein
MRRRLLSVVGRRVDDGRETLVLKPRGDDKTYEVADPGLDDDAAEALRDDLSRIFDLDRRASSETRRGLQVSDLRIRYEADARGSSMITTKERAAFETDTERRLAEASGTPLLLEVDWDSFEMRAPYPVTMLESRAVPSVRRRPARRVRGARLARYGA